MNKHFFAKHIKPGSFLKTGFSPKTQSTYWGWLFYSPRLQTVELTDLSCRQEFGWCSYEDNVR